MRGTRLGAIGAAFAVAACAPAEDSGTTRGAPVDDGEATWWVGEVELVGVAPTDQHHATVATRPDGRWIVSWDEALSKGSIVRVRVYDPDGRPLGPVREVARIANAIARPDVVETPDGWAIVAGDDADVWISLLDVNGTVASKPVRVNETPGLDENASQPDIAWLPSGPIVLWRQEWPDGTRYLVRTFAPDLTPLGGEVLIAISDQEGSPPDVEALPDGGFVATWVENVDGLRCVHVGWFDDTGAVVHVDRVNDTADQGPTRPTVAVDPMGRVALAWRLTDGALPLGARGRLYDADGSPLSDVLPLGGPTADRTVAAFAGDAAIFAWEEGWPSDLVVQAWDAPTAEPITEPVTVGAYGGERPSVDAAPLEGDDWSVVVTAESALAAEDVRVVVFAPLELRR